MSNQQTSIHPRLMRRAKRQGGQILPITLAGVVLAVVVLFMLGNIGNRITEKSVAVDAADAAAFSGATWVAQHLNFMAYTNRAMVANHIGVGHFVAYMSWIRYVDDTVDKVEDLVSAIPVINVIAGVLEQAADLLRQLAEIEGEIFVPVVDNINLFYHASQLEAHAILGLPTNLPLPGSGQFGGLPVTPMDRLMQATAESFDSDIRINDFGDIAKLDSSMSVPLIALLALQNPRIVTFVRPQDAESGGGVFRPELVRFVEATYGKSVDLDGPIINDPENGGGLNPNLPDVGLDLTQFKGEMSSGWLNDRRVIPDPFSLFDFLPVPKAFEDAVKDFLDFPIVKNFSTEHTLTNDITNWETTDSLGFPGDDEGAAGFSSGEASAREFSSDYTGIHGWYDLTIPIPGHQILPIIAYASKDQSGSDTSQGFGLEANDEPLSGIAIAHVEHRRPTEGFEPLISLPIPNFPGKGPIDDFIFDTTDFDLEANSEYANMFNPFWRAKIVGTHYSDLKQADPLTNIIEGIF